MAYQVHNIDDFSGGLRYGTSNNIVEEDEGTQFANVISMPGNYLRSRSGYTLKNTGLTGAVTGAYINGIYQFYSASSNYLICTTCNSTGLTGAGIFRFVNSSKNFYNITGSTTFNPGTTNLPFFETFQGYLVIVNGNNAPIVWDGSTTYCKQFDSTGLTGTQYYSISGTSCTPKFVKAFKDYLFFAYMVEGGITYKSRIRWCYPGDPSTWPSENYLDLDADDGDEITGMAVLGNYIIVFKEKKIFILSYVGGTLVFDYEIAINGRGCVSASSIINLLNTLIFLAEDGVYSFDGSNFKELSSNVKNYFLEMNPDKRSIAVAELLEELDQIWIAFPYLSSTTNNKVGVLNYTNAEKECWAFHDIDCATLGAYYREDKLTFGDLPLAFKYYDFKFGDRRGLASSALLISSDYDGNIYDHNQGTTDNGSAFTAKWASKYLDLAVEGYPDSGIRNKVLMCVGVLVKHKIDADYTLTLKVYHDRDESNYDSFDITLYDTNREDQDYLYGEAYCKIPAREFKLELTTDGAGEAWEVHRIHLEYNYKGKKKITRY